VRTTSSVTFDYRPQTRPINSRLLAEEERLEVAAAEETSVEELRAEVALSQSRRNALSELATRSQTTEAWAHIAGAQAVDPLSARLSLEAQQAESMSLSSGLGGFAGQMPAGEPAEQSGINFGRPDEYAQRGGQAAGRTAGGAGLSDFAALEGLVNAAADNGEANLRKRLASPLIADLDGSSPLQPNATNLNRYFLGKQLRQLVVVADGVQGMWHCWPASSRTPERCSCPTWDSKRPATGIRR
jgi:hypothetical protein